MASRSHLKKRCFFSQATDAHPNDHLNLLSRDIGETSGVNIQDANLLKIKVTYGYRMYVPITNQFIATLLKVTDPENAHYYNDLTPIC
jgi:hypothetical protein